MDDEDELEKAKKKGKNNKKKLRKKAKRKRLKDALEMQNQMNKTQADGDATNAVSDKHGQKVVENQLVDATKGDQDD